MAVVCNPIRMGRWSELMVVCVCHSYGVMREADANDKSGELGSALPGSLVGESVYISFIFFNILPCNKLLPHFHYINQFTSYKLVDYYICGIFLRH